MSRRKKEVTFPYLTEDEAFQFPSPLTATKEGIVAMGGNLSPGMLISAYSQGIFPWYSEDSPILWWSPDPRFVLFPEELHVPQSLEKVFRKGIFTFTWDTRFLDVITACSRTPRPNQDGTWITDEMIDAYTELYRLGYAHSLEVYKGGELVGGLYGVSLGSAFFGESMFSWEPNASKSGLVVLVRFLNRKGFRLIDSQVYTQHLARFGARNISRLQYLTLLREALKKPTLKGSWNILFPDFPNT
ncbi:MAG: leucyl/phenylalanyl-tRNA--protein transferase [Spirochaetes bacterium]|nr:leucyl/phenylalanyl-tRNA--protein transferase [Spirochaetota bacterium]